MQCLALHIVFAIMINFVSCCDHQHKKGTLNSVSGIADGTKERIARYIRDPVYDDEYEYETTRLIYPDTSDYIAEYATELAEWKPAMEADELNCESRIRYHLENECYDIYYRMNIEAEITENEKERTETVCCTLEEYEKCILRAVDQHSCVNEKEEEKMWIARHLEGKFGITCSELRGRCAVYLPDSAATSTSFLRYIILLLILGQFLS